MSTIIQQLSSMNMNAKECLKSLKTINIQSCTQLTKFNLL